MPRASVALHLRHLRARPPRGARVRGSSAPVALGLEALAPALSIARTTASPQPAGGGDPASAAAATLLTNQEPRRGHLYRYKGTRGARIVSARKGELMRSFRGAQIRDHWRARVTRGVWAVHAGARSRRVV